MSGTRERCLVHRVLPNGHCQKCGNLIIRDKRNRRRVFQPMDGQSPLKPGAVCSWCGRTVTEREYSSGESTCCHKEVTAEEFYGRSR